MSTLLLGFIDVRRPALLAGVLTAACAAGAARAQWTVTNLHPSGATESYGYGIGAGVGGVQQVGYATISGVSHACLWSRTAVTWADLHPPGIGSTLSIAYGVSGNQQAGVVTVGSFTLAASWTGTPASWQNLNPTVPFGQSSVGYGVQNGVVVGRVGTSSGTTACQWVGTTLTSYPTGAVANAIDGSLRAGATTVGSFPLFASQAMLWSGPSLTSTNLHPSAAYASVVKGLSGTVEAGQATIGGLTGQSHACLWTGTAASWVDQHPSVGTASECSGVFNGQEVGSVQIVDPTVDPQNAVPRASLWNGTAASWVNLHALLPASFIQSYAKGIWSDGSAVYVVGYGFNNTTGRNEALLWTHQLCGACHADFNCSGTLEIADIFAFLNAWFAGSSSADFDGVNGLQVADIFAFLNAWFAGC